MQSSTEVLTTLRKITITAFPPSFILNLIDGIASHNAFPGLLSLLLAQPFSVPLSSTVIRSDTEARYYLCLL